MKAQLDAGDVGAADHGEHLNLFLEQPGLLIVIVEEGRRDAERAAGAWITRNCGSVAWPLRSQIVVWENCAMRNT